MAKVVFMGTPEFAVAALTALIEKHEVIGVVTQPDRPAGRQRQLQQSPIKTLAQAHSIPVFQPEKIRQAEAIAELQQWQADVYVVAAFGQILPQTVLDLPLHGSLNIHASLLPRWRGAAPIQAAIRAGDPDSGITIMKMDAGLDTGPVLSKAVVPLEPDETGQSLHDKLATLGAELLIATLPGYLDGSIRPQPQDDEMATYAPMMKKADGEIYWRESADAIERLVRAFTPWPGTYTTWNGEQLKIRRATVAVGRAAPGQVVTSPAGIAVGTGDELLIPKLVQLAGRKALPLAEFVKGRPDFSQAVLGT